MHADVEGLIFFLVDQRVDKGDEIGYFQFGGSTYCLLFEAGVIDRFLYAPPFDGEPPVVQVNASVAIAR